MRHHSYGLREKLRDYAARKTVERSLSYRAATVACRSRDLLVKLLVGAGVLISLLAIIIYGGWGLLASVVLGLVIFTIISEIGPDYLNPNQSPYFDNLVKAETRRLRLAEEGDAELPEGEHLWSRIETEMEYKTITNAMADNLCPYCFGAGCSGCNENGTWTGEPR